MDYSAAERERAESRVEDLRNGGEAYCDIALDLQMELNRAVDLLRRTTHSPKPGTRYPLWRSIQDFLSHYPEGELR